MCRRIGIAPDEERTRYELGFDAHFSKAVQATLTPFYYDIKNAKVSDGSITKDAQGNPLIDAATVQSGTDHGFRFLK